jgi:predicted Zn finger-like uncharacterized protein
MPTINCPACQAMLRVPEGAQGRKVKCSKCATPFVVPGNPTPLPQPAPLVAQILPVNQFSPRPIAPPVAQAMEPQWDSTPRPAAKKSSLLLYSSIGGGAFLAVTLVVSAILFFWPGSSKNSSGEQNASSTPKNRFANDLKYVPDGTDQIYAIQVDKVLASGGYQSLLQGNADFGQNATLGARQIWGIEPKDIATVLFSRQPGGSSHLVVIRTNRLLTAKEVLQNRNQDNAPHFVVPVRSYQVYDVESGDDFCLVDGRTLLIGPRPVLESVLLRKDQVALSPALQKALPKINFHAMVSGGIGGNVPIGPGSPPEVIWFDGDLDTTFRFRFIAQFQTSLQAQRIKTSIDEVTRMAKGQPGNLLENGQLTLSGNQLLLSLSTPADTVAREPQVKQLLQNLLKYSMAPSADSSSSQYTVTVKANPTGNETLMNRKRVFFSAGTTVTIRVTSDFQTDVDLYLDDPNDRELARDNSLSKNCIITCPITQTGYHTIVLDNLGNRDNICRVSYQIQP